MATVPTAPRVTANQISPQRTDLTGITEFRGAGATAKAQTQFGQAVSGASDQLAKLGAQIQLGDEKRDLTQKELEIRKVFSDYETGAPAPMTPDGIPGQQGIAGYRADKKEDALRNAPARKKEVEDAINKILERGGSAGWVDAELRLRAQNRGQVFDTGYESYLMDERLAADKEVIIAGIEQTMGELASILPSEVNREQLEQAGVSEITLAVTLKLKNEGITNQKSIDNAVKKELSFAHERRIKWLQSQGFNTYAKDYFSKIEGQLTDQMSSTLNDITRVGAVGDQAFAAVNTYITEGKITSRAGMRAQARLDSGGNSQLFDAMVADITSYWTGKDTADAEELADAEEAANVSLANGFLKVTPAQQILLVKAGKWKALETAHAEKWSGLPMDNVAYDALSSLKTQGKFVDEDLNTSYWRKNLGKQWATERNNQVAAKALATKTLTTQSLSVADLRIKAKNPADLRNATTDYLDGKGLTGPKNAEERGQILFAAGQILVSRVDANQTSFEPEDYLAMVKLAETQIKTEKEWSWFDEKQSFAAAIINGENRKITEGLPSLIKALDKVYPLVNEKQMKDLVNNLVKRGVLPTPTNINILLRANKKGVYASGPKTIAERVALAAINKNRPQPVASTLADTGDPTGAPTVSAPTVSAPTVSAAKITTALGAKPTPAVVEAVKEIQEQKTKVEKLKQTAPKVAAKMIDVNRMAKAEVQKALDRGEEMSAELLEDAFDLAAARAKVQLTENKMEALVAPFRKLNAEAVAAQAPRRAEAIARRRREAAAQKDKNLQILSNIKGLPLRAEMRKIQKDNESKKRWQLMLEIDAFGDLSSYVDTFSTIADQTAAVGQGMEDSEAVADPTDPVGQGMEDSEAVADPTDLVGQGMEDSEAVADQTAAVGQGMEDSEAVADPTDPVGQGMEDSEAVADPVSVSPKGEFVPIKIPAEIAPLDPDEREQAYDQGRVAGRTARRLKLHAKIDAIKQYNKTGSAVSQLKLHEGGKVPFVYPDGDGNLTAGIGHKLTKDELARWKKGDMVSTTQVEKWFKADYALAKRQIATIFKDTLTPEARDVLVSMVFNMGLGYATKRTPEELGFGYPGEVIPGKGLKSFGGMLRALKSSPPDYARAAEEMTWVNADTKTANTKWYNQTGNRAEDLINIMKSQKI
mgnify:CR=1 FL=1